MTSKIVVIGKSNGNSWSTISCVSPKLTKCSDLPQFQCDPRPGVSEERMFSYRGTKRMFRVGTVKCYIHVTRIICNSNKVLFHVVRCNLRVCSVYESFAASQHHLCYITKSRVSCFVNEEIARAKYLWKIDIRISQIRDSVNVIYMKIENLINKKKI